MTIRMIATCGALLVAGGCDSPFGPSGEVLPVVRLTGEPRSFTWHSGLTDPERIVVRDATAWAVTWKRIWAPSSPPPPLPEIDFAQEMVVVAALGQRPTNGYDIFIDTATASGADVSVSVRSVASCGFLTVVTHPVDVARLPRRTGKVRFKEKEDQGRPCPVP